MATTDLMNSSVPPATSPPPPPPLLTSMITNCLTFDRPARVFLIGFQSFVNSLTSSDEFELVTFGSEI